LSVEICGQAGRINRELEEEMLEKILAVQFSIRIVIS
jgi:hypothetical protein